MPPDIQILFFGWLVVLAAADWKYRVVPGCEVFFAGAVLLAVLCRSQSLLALGAGLLAVAYGALRMPAPFALPLLLWPPSWPTLLIGYGVRKEILGRADLFTIAGISALYPVDVALAALVGTALWIRFWPRQPHGHDPLPLIPLLPGMVIGAGLALICRALLDHPLAL